MPPLTPQPLSIRMEEITLLLTYAFVAGTVFGMCVIPLTTHVLTYFSSQIESKP